MKTIGMIGGMSWESTVTYYQIINRTIKEKLGGFHSAKCLLYSVDFHEIEECQSRGDWDHSADILSEAAISFERGGAEFIIICTNTMHKVADRIRERSGSIMSFITSCVLVSYPTGQNGILSGSSTGS